MDFFFQAEDGIRDLVRSRGLGDVYKRQLFNMPYTDRLNGAHMVRYSERRPGGIFWGYFDETGKFVGQGYANVDPPADARHTLRVVSAAETYSLYLDDFLLAADLPLRQNYGYVGFVTRQRHPRFHAVGGVSLLHN